MGLRHEFCGKDGNNDTNVRQALCISDTSSGLCHDLVRQALFAQGSGRSRSLPKVTQLDTGKLGHEPRHVAVIKTVKDDHSGYHI